MARLPNSVDILVNLHDRLEAAFVMQQDLQRVMPPLGRDFPSADPIEHMEQLRTSSLGLFTEVCELLRETGWKPWASSNHVNHDGALGEAVDVFHFFINLCLLCGITPDELWAGFVAKQRINRERQRVGYDGVSTKCPGCKAAYDDQATQCVPGGTRDAGGTPIKFNPWCYKLGHHIIPAEAIL